MALRRVVGFGHAGVLPVRRAGWCSTEQSSAACDMRTRRWRQHAGRGRRCESGAAGGGGDKSEARPMIGDLVDFPCMFCFKVIGLRQGDFVNDIADSVCNVLEIERKSCKVDFRDKGKYRSITLRAPCNSAEQVYAIYSAIDRDPRVKFKF